MPKLPSSHPAPFRTFDRRTDDVPKMRHAMASTATNCGSIPKVIADRFQLDNVAVCCKVMWDFHKDVSYIDEYFLYFFAVRWPLAFSLDIHADQLYDQPD